LAIYETQYLQCPHRNSEGVKSARCQTLGVLLAMATVGGRIFITWHSTFSNDVEFLSTKDSISKIIHGPVHSKWKQTDKRMRNATVPTGVLPDTPV